MPSLRIADGHVHELHLFEVYKIMNHRLFCPCHSPIHFPYSLSGIKYLLHLPFFVSSSFIEFVHRCLVSSDFFSN